MESVMKNLFFPFLKRIFIYIYISFYNIGDDEFSIAFDGCRNLVWYNAQCTPHSLPSWKPGDVLGCLLDIEQEKVIFSLNGMALEPYRQLFNSVK